MQLSFWYAKKEIVYVPGATGAVIVKVSVYEPIPSWFGVLIQVNAPEFPMRQDVERQFALPPELEVDTFRTTVIVPPGPTVTVAPPLTVAELIVRASLKVPLTDTAEVNPTAV